MKTIEHPHPGLTALFDLKRHQRPNESDMTQIRDYLTSQGAECVVNNSGIQEWCQGMYSAAWRAEHWVGPKGHDLWLRFSGPNPVGPQQNGWSVDRQSKCPEWALAKVDQHYAHFAKLYAAAHKATSGSRREQSLSSMQRWAKLTVIDDLGNPQVAEAIETVQELMADALKEFDQE